MQIAQFVEGQAHSLEGLAAALANTSGDAESAKNAVKNLLFTEATRKSYCHDKRAHSDAQPACS